MVALSTNKLYRGRRYRSSAYEKYRKEVFSFLQDNVPKNNVCLTDKPLDLYIEVGLSSVLADLSNCVKGIEDIVSQYFEFNDRMVIDIQMKKYIVKKGDEYVKLKLRTSRRHYDLRRAAG